MLSGYRDTMIHCRKHFELHQHEMHNICITTNISSIHFATMRVYEFYLWGHVGATWAHESWRQCPMATANTGAADITHAYPSHQGDCGQIGDNPQIQLSGVKWPSAGVTECRYFPGYRVLLWWRVKMCDTGWHSSWDSLYGAQVTPRGLLSPHYTQCAIHHDIVQSVAAVNTSLSWHN